MKIQTLDFPENLNFFVTNPTAQSVVTAVLINKGSLIFFFFPFLFALVIQEWRYIGFFSFTTSLVLEQELNSRPPPTSLFWESPTIFNGYVRPNRKLLIARKE